MLLDNQSTVNIFCNGDLLTDIRWTNKSITIHTNGGETLVNTVRYFRGYGWVEYDPQGITDILSLKNMKSLYRVTYDSMSDNDGHFVVHCHTGPIIFQQSQS